MGETTYYQRNRETILTSAKDYYENNKVLKKNINKYTELPEEKKNVKREYGWNRYHNMSEEKNQRLKEYKKNCREANKN